MTTASAISSARPPRPEPRTIPTRGTTDVRARTASTRGPSRAGCSAGGIGRARSIDGRVVRSGYIRASGYASRGDGRGRSFTRAPTGVIDDRDVEIFPLGAPAAVRPMRPARWQRSARSDRRAGDVDVISVATAGGIEVISAVPGGTP